LRALQASAKCARDPQKSERPHSMGVKTTAPTSMQKALPLLEPTPPEGKSLNANGRESPQLWDCKELNHSYGSTERKEQRKEVVSGKAPASPSTPAVSTHRDGETRADCGIPPGCPTPA